MHKRLINIIKATIIEIIVAFLLVVLSIIILEIAVGQEKETAITLINAMSLNKENVIINKPVLEGNIIKNYPEYGSKYAKIQIPKININLDVYYGDTMEILKKGVGHSSGSYFPGEGGTIACMAHNTRGYLYDLPKIEQGAEIVMLPYFKTVEEVEKFIKFVNKRAKVCLLVETPEAVDRIDEILSLDGIDEVHIGLNDLHLGYKMNFMFERLADGTVDKLCKKFKAKNIPYGCGGVSRVGTGRLPAEHIIIEHYRLGSQIVILSRSFCNTQKITDRKEIKELFDTGVRDIRKTEKEAMKFTKEQFEENKIRVQQEVATITNEIKKGV